MERKVRIKINGYKEEWIYSDLTGVIKERSFAKHCCQVFLDEKSAFIIQRHNHLHNDGYTIAPFISRKNIIFLDGLQIE